MTVLAIERLTVGPGELEAVVRVDPGLLRTSCAPRAATRVRELMPGLARHTCDNDRGTSFMVEIEDTETAHLLEHVACEFMALAGSPRSLRGSTAWDFTRDGAGTFRIALQFDNDLVAIGALKHAADVVRWAMSDVGERPDVERLAADLRTARGRVG